MKYAGRPVAANVSILFTEHDYLDRFAAAAAAGFDLVESWWPFATATPEPAAVDELIERIRRSGLSLIALNVWAGDMPGGERGVATLEGRSTEIAASLATLRRIAEATGCARFNLLLGRLDDPLAGTPEQAWRRAVDTVRQTADQLRDVGTVLIEPLSGLPTGAFPVTTDAQAVDFVTACDRENVAILFDAYHLGANDVDLAAAVRRTSGLVAHVQLADAPGRGAPGTGSLPLRETVEQLVAAGYDGPIGAEYAPGAPTESTLGWVDPAV